jgi:hypothetical protein
MLLLKENTPAGLLITLMKILCGTQEVFIRMLLLFYVILLYDLKTLLQIESFLNHLISLFLRINIRIT